jgi:hypothetical protein
MYTLGDPIPITVTPSVSTQDYLVTQSSSGLVVIPFKVGPITKNLTVGSVWKKNVTPNLSASYSLATDYSDYVSLFFLVIGCICAYLFFKNKKQAALPLHEQKITNYHEHWKKLYDLCNPDNFPKQIQPFYFESSESLKLYLDKTENTDLAEKTILEIEQVLKKSTLLEKSKLLEALQQAEFVKFANYIPMHDEYRGYCQLIRTFLAAHEPEQTL